MLHFIHIYIQKSTKPKNFQYPSDHLLILCTFFVNPHYARSSGFFEQITTCMHRVLIYYKDILKMGIMKTNFQAAIHI